MNYTIAVIENIHGGRKVFLNASGNKKYIVIEEEGREPYFTKLLAANEADRVFGQLCEYTYKNLYSFEQLCLLA